MTFLGMDPPEFSRPPKTQGEKQIADAVEAPAAAPGEKNLVKAIPQIEE
jgi:hypothetical protein